MIASYVFTVTPFELYSRREQDPSEHVFAIAVSGMDRRYLNHSTISAAADPNWIQRMSGAGQERHCYLYQPKMARLVRVNKSEKQAINAGVRDDYPD